MKYYETNFEEYVHSVHKFNIHPEIQTIIDKLPDNLIDLPNIILYGPSGVGKYSQMLNLLYKYSPSKFKYDKKLSIVNEKNEKKNKTSTKESSTNTSNKKSPSTNNSSKTLSTTKKNDFIYRISDIHYEIDMSTLGCNPKTVWHDVFFQIVDIISVKPNKTGVIVCKNFHGIYNELLDIFNSYIRHPFYNIKISFILITEQISFIPESIVNYFLCIPVKRSCIDSHVHIVKNQNKTFYGQNNAFSMTNGERQLLTSNIESIQPESISNLKEVHILKTTQLQELPKDVFNIITDTILSKIINPEQIKIQEFRNDLYDLLIYNIDIPDAIYYMITFLVEKHIIDDEYVHDILQHSFTFLKYYNNNYRPIYHLENMIYFIIHKIHFNTSL